MEVQRIGVLVKSGLDEIPTSVLAHEIPVLIQQHGRDRIRFVEEQGTEYIADPEAEYSRLERTYRRMETGLHAVEAAYPGGGIMFEARIADGDAIVAALKREATRRSAESHSIDQVQPKPGDAGYLDMDELTAMVTSLAGEAPPSKMPRNMLRAHAIIALDTASREVGIKAGRLDTDPDLTKAHAAIIEARTKIEADREREGNGEGSGPAA